MTVRELIDHLSLLPQDAEVLVCDGVAEGDRCEGIEGVYLESYRVMGREGAIRTAIIAAQTRTRLTKIEGPALANHV